MRIKFGRYRNRLIAFTLLILFSTAAVSLTAGYSSISKEQLKSQLANPDLVLLDVRASLGWILSFSRIKGAEREDPGKVESWLTNYSKDKTIVLYCQGQNTSSNVAQKLVSAGFQKVYVLKGGWNEWSKANFPTEKK